jgi:hypothetical protein
LSWHELSGAETESSGSDREIAGLQGRRDISLKNAEQGTKKESRLNFSAYRRGMPLKKNQRHLPLALHRLARHVAKVSQT